MQSFDFFRTIVIEIYGFDVDSKTDRTVQTRRRGCSRGII